MSRIADKIRAYVNDYSVSEHYGEWGILRPDQRRLIRELCDTCDMFEKTADEFAYKQHQLKGQEKFFEALDSIIWYDGHYEWLKAMRDDMENILKTGDKYVNYSAPFEPTEWHTEQHTIYMILVGMFGDWGTSIRSGWIEDIKGCIEFIDAICKSSWEEKEERKKGGSE